VTINLTKVHIVITHCSCKITLNRLCTVVSVTLKYDKPEVENVASHEGAARVRHFQPRVHHLSMSHERPCLICFVIWPTTSLNITKNYSFLINFYRAMLCIRGTSHSPVSVCPSVCLSVTSRSSTKTAKRRITQTIPHDCPWTLFSEAKDLCKIQPRSPPKGAPNAGGVGQNRRLSKITGYISKTVQDRRMVSVKVE